MGGIYYLAFDACEIRGRRFNLFSKIIIFGSFILHLMKEWSAFNGQGSGSVLGIWQLFAIFYEAIIYLDLRASIKFLKDPARCLH